MLLVNERPYGDRQTELTDTQRTRIDTLCCFIAEHLLVLCARPAHRSDSGHSRSNASMLTGKTSYSLTDNEWGKKGRF